VIRNDRSRSRAVPNKVAPFLRQYNSDEESWREQVRMLRHAVSIADGPAEAAAALGRLGDHLRTSRDHAQEAIDILRKAIEKSEAAMDPPLLAANRLRLAVALQYADRHHDALDEHQRAMALIREHGVDRLADFAWQHRGKCMAEIGEYEQARQCFLNAM
jgi:HTH-type transcriptional regulator, pleiotropic regulator of extracellular virulence genes